MSRTIESGYGTARRKPRWAMLLLIAGAHIAALFGLAAAFAPDWTAEAIENVGSLVTVQITAPEDPEPEVTPEPEPKPDEGAAAPEGPQAKPKEVMAPEPPVKVNPKPVPRARSDGEESRSGAGETGAGTGAGGEGEGTGSGRGGDGQGGLVPVTKPVHISGQIENARDYPVPPGGRQARRGTEVIVQVTVGADGRARNCRVYQPSPDAEADRITCDLVESRLRFRPATNAQGEPVAAPFYWRQKWF